MAVLSALAMIVSVTFVAPASARGHGGYPPGGDTIADGLAGPLSIDVDHRGSVLVAQGFSGTASRVSKQGSMSDLFNVPGLSAIANGPFGSVIYSTVLGSEEDPSVIPEASLEIRLPNGRTRQLADLGRFEREHNPDGDVVYGVSLSDDCAAQWPIKEAGPPQYTGDVNPNPYAIAVTAWGVYVADAGANALLFVTWWGSIHVVTVFDPQPMPITAELAEANGIPECAVGNTYYNNPVPTDIEVTPSGGYVSLLPGGPEDPSAGARGVVLRVNLWNGRTQTIGTGFAGATDVAVSPRGEVFVAELFGNRVSKLGRHGSTTVAEFVEPAAVEWSNGNLYVAHGVFSGPGAISVLRG